jgi:hypothetical protein
LQPLKEAIKTGNAQAILAALPEPPVFMEALFNRVPTERDHIIADVFSAYF